jgi:hypothetical protein
LLDWFRKNLPKDNYLSEEIAKRAEAAFSKIEVPSDELFFEPFKMGIGNNPENPKRLDITMNVYAIMFLGIMAKAILDSLTSEFEGLLSGDIGKQILDAKIKEIMTTQISKDEKAYLECQTMNRANAKFCNECGNKF